MFNFEKLDVWKKAVEFANEIYNITEDFPKKELFGTINQLRRAVVSISSNIAEGSGRKSKKEFKYFLSMAYGSLCEVITLLKISLKRKYLAQDKYDKLYQNGEEIGKMLSGLSKLKEVES